MKLLSSMKISRCRISQCSTQQASKVALLTRPTSKGWLKIYVMMQIIALVRSFLPTKKTSKSQRHTRKASSFRQVSFSLKWTRTERCYSTPATPTSVLAWLVTRLRSQLYSWWLSGTWPFCKSMKTLIPTRLKCEEKCLSLVWAFVEWRFITPLEVTINK